MPNFGVAHLLTKVGIVRFLFGLCLLLCGSALGYYLGRPADSATTPHDAASHPFTNADGNPVDARQAWRNYFVARQQARQFVDDPKPHPFFVAAGFAVLGTAVLGLGAALGARR